MPVYLPNTHGTEIGGGLGLELPDFWEDKSWGFGVVQTQYSAGREVSCLWPFALKMPSCSLSPLGTKKEDWLELAGQRKETLAATLPPPLH